MPARRTARHRADIGTLAAITPRRRTRRPRRTSRRVGPPLLLAGLLAIASLTITTPSDAADADLRVPAPTARTVGG